MTNSTEEDKKQAEKPRVEEDDEDDDEDYNPEQDKDSQQEGGDELMDTEVIIDETSVLAPSQKKAVDEAFQELFGYSWGTSFQLPRRRRLVSNDETVNLLVQVLGPVRAARVLQSGGAIRPRRKRQAKTTLVKWAKTTDSATAAGSSSSTTQPQKQYETKLFAGQKIQVAVASVKPKQTATAAAAASSGGIDNMLQQIAGPSKISTVAKTSADWDTFKTDTGLEAELEKKAQGKDAFLVKQDFLTRVDNRKFELERDVRDKERAKRGK